MEFQLVPFGRHPTAQFLTRVILLAATAACVALGALYLTGRLSGGTAVFFVLAAFTAAIVAIWRFWREDRGSVWIDATNLVVKTGAGRQVYGWTTVGQISLVSFSQLAGLSDLTARLTGLDRESTFVEVALNKRPRISLLPYRAGTDTLGVPQLFTTRLHLHVVHPQEFLRMAEHCRGLSRAKEQLASQEGER